MTEKVLFDSRQACYKEPGGAVPTGTALTLRIAVRADVPVRVVSLVIRHDDTAEPAYCPMMITESAEYDVYETTYTVEQKGLYWYYFELDTEDGMLRIGRGKGGCCDNGEGQASWQQTVYEQAYESPDWIYGGIFYHVFVDRFNHSGERIEMEGKINRSDWGGMPEYKPVDGEMLNNDFFGGNLDGIREKLPYLAGLGVTCLYLSPIVEAYSNHKYDTADYRNVDPMFGSMADFEALCSEAADYGMRVICDGVFAHTGSDSVYFNKKGRYGDGGAWNDPESPYRSWYFFHEDGSYDSWWGIDTLPRVNKDDPGYREFINGPEGVARYWLSHGAAGWRLDVADELPSAFLTELVAAAKEEKPDALILGEVWEDASNKTAYEERKNYFRGDRLDSVMNYPLKNAIIRCVRHGEAETLAKTVETIWENYPPYVIHALMNHLGTHDSFRILTALAGEELDPETPREIQAATHMNSDERQTGIRRLMTASLLQMTLPGVPCIYYGDEAGTEGYKDPFNRTCYPWGGENTELLSWYRRLTSIRRDHPVYRTGDYRTAAACGGLYAFSRSCDQEEIITAVNCSDQPRELTLEGSYTDLLQKRDYRGTIILAPGERSLLLKND